MLKRRLFFLLLICLLAPVAAGQHRVPTVDDLLNVKSLGGAQISPDGKWVAYTITESDFKQDAYVTHVWLVEAQSGRRYQLTRGDKSAGNPQWSPDGQWLTFTSNRIGDKNQIFVIRPDGGEATQLTKTENGVSREGSQRASRRFRGRAQGV
jgi:Tol biopolymer transport system component